MSEDDSVATSLAVTALSIGIAVLAWIEFDCSPIWVLCSLVIGPLLGIAAESVCHDT